ncbi:hypothetical protein [Paraburkholderia phenazinium]|jgi:hypothetical protein|uniref:Uncharacterized protein n=1 Tax=Paraburkholderia phenazinium TaxID=60549 RepID=A0A1N6L792_9BURK|nr:hypothetical protein [Paraburkholderia phenazinium]SIO64664.1 hypothetical protein SAMN05444165_6442 [Paraburkholderia phenazinium]
MLNHNDQSAINPAGDGPAPRGNSGISTALPPDTQQDTKRDCASEWIQSAMRTSKEMHRNEDFRREVAKRLF